MVRKRFFSVSNMILILKIILLTLLLSAGQATGAEDAATEEKNTEVEKKAPGLEVIVSVEGLNDAEKANALVYLEIEKNKENPELNEKLLKIFHSRAVENIKQSLNPFGYYQAEVDSSLEQDASGVWQARYQVKPGERVKITKVDLQINGSGANESDVVAVKEKFPIKINDVLDHDIYESSKTEQVTLIGKLGYSEVKFEKKQLLIDPEKNSAEITLHINTGEKFFLGEFRIHQDFLQPELVKKFIVDEQPGDPYSQESLLDIQQSLIKSGYFSVVDIRPKFSEVEEQRVPIDMTLTQAKQHIFSFGGGYDTDIELNVSMGWQNRLINSHGHHSDVKLKLSDIQSTLSATYWIPVGDPRNEKVGLTAKAESETLDSVKWNVLDLEAAYHFKWREWDSKLFTEYKVERATIDKEPSQTNQLLSFGGEMNGLFFEEGVYPRKGWAAFGNLRAAPAIVFSDTAYLRMHIKSRIIFPMFDKGRLILRGELGFAEVEDTDHYPGSLRFFAGGDQSVRGYDWKSLGPVNSNGDVIGGENVVTSSIEYNHQVSPQWVAAAFIDAGNAYNGNLKKLYYGTGFGARWISPVGLVRFDLGFPVNGNDDVNESSSAVFYFGFEVNL